MHLTTPGTVAPCIFRHIRDQYPSDESIVAQKIRMDGSSHSIGSVLTAHARHVVSSPEVCLSGKRQVLSSRPPRA